MTGFAFWSCQTRPAIYRKGREEKKEKKVHFAPTEAGHALFPPWERTVMSTDEAFLDALLQYM
jgi:hypothetical protein